MKDIPILFSAPMIRALLAGRKTNSRRMSEQWMKVKAGDRLWVRETWQGWRRTSHECDEYETMSMEERGGKTINEYAEWYGVNNIKVTYKADGKSIADSWIPSIHMPRWASRITLEATEDARREPLADISEADAISEGVGTEDLPPDPDNFHPPGSYGYISGITPDCLIWPRAKEAFYELWDSLHAKDAPVSSNPVPVRLAFRVVA